MAAQAGILYSDLRPISPSVVAALCRANVSFGPDGARVFTAPGVALIAFALHYDDLSTRDLQPTLGPTGSVLTFDGRLDNRHDFLVSLEPDGVAAHTDSGLFALAIDEWSDRALSLAVGDWSLVHWTHRRRELLLARDYVGNRQLYYLRGSDFFAWSTAIDALVELGGLRDSINESYVTGLLTFGPPPHQTYYRGIFEVPPGHALRISSALTPRMARYSALKYGVLRYRTDAEYHDQYRSLLIDAVRVRLRARRTVWAELSGGYDSSTIVCIASGLIQKGMADARDLQPVSIVAPESPESDESVYIAHVERHCCVRSRRLPLVDVDEFSALVQNASTFAGAPSPRSTSAPVNSAGSHVLLSGTLGDEVTVPWSANDVLSNHLAGGHGLAFVVDSIKQSRATRKPLYAVLRDAVGSALSPVDDAVQMRRNYLRALGAPPRYTLQDAARIFALRPECMARVLADRDTSTDQTDAPRHILAFISALRKYAARGVLSGSRDVPSVLVTFPFSHRPLVEFVLSIPPEAIWSPHYPRAFLCRAFRDILPAAILQRRSKGRAGPALYRSRMALLSTVLTNLHEWRLVTRGYVDPDALANLINGFINGTGTIGGRLGAMLSTELLMRRRESVDALPAPAEVVLTHT